MGNKPLFMCHLSESPVLNLGKKTRSPQIDLTPWILTLVRQLSILQLSIGLLDWAISIFPKIQNNQICISSTSVAFNNGERPFEISPFRRRNFSKDRQQVSCIMSISKWIMVQVYSVPKASQMGQD